MNLAPDLCILQVYAKFFAAISSGKSIRVATADVDVEKLRAWQAQLGAAGVHRQGAEPRDKMKEEKTEATKVKVEVCEGGLHRGCGTEAATTRGYTVEGSRRAR